MNSKWLKTPVIFLISILVPLSFSSIGRASTVDVNTAPSAYVSDSLYFPVAAMALATAELKKQETYAKDFLSQAAKTSNSLQIAKSANNFKNTQVSKYPKLATYLSDLSVIGSGDWGSKAGPKSFQPSNSTNPSSHLVTITPGACRLSWSLFNSDTWFEPDCKVKVASARQYLQASLIDYNEHSAELTTSGYFIELESLKAIAEGNSGYTVSNGALFSPDLDPMLIYTGLALRFRSVDGTTGYDIKIDPVNKRHFTFSLTPPNNQLRASWAKLVTRNGATTITFDKPTY
jgi:hypothetical protein